MSVAIDTELELQDAILDGSRGSHLWVVGAGDGRVLEKHEVDAVPAWDGMAAAGGCIYLSCGDGTVVCMAGE